MTEFALVGPADEIKDYSSRVDPAVGTKAGWRWLPVAVSDVVAGEGEVREGPVVKVEASRVLRAWTKRAKTAAELDWEKEGQLPAAADLIFKVLFNHENRVRALEGKAAVTAAQFRAALKAML